MRILVTGATGFVGSHLVPILHERGHDVVAISRDSSRAENLKWPSDIKFIAGDIHNPSAGPDYHRLGSPDALIHLAWPGLPNYNDLFHFESNLPLDYKFIKSMVSQGLKQVLVTGTCFEYGMQNGCLSEDMVTRPANPYALAKDSLRKFLQSLQRHSEYTLQWTRLFYMYGTRQGANSLLAQLDHAIDARQRVFNMSGGEQLRDYLPVEDVVTRISMLVEKSDLDGVYNCCSGVPISVRSLVEQRIQERGANIDLNLGHYPYPAHEPMAFWGNNTNFNRDVVKE